MISCSYFTLCVCWQVIYFYDRLLHNCALNVSLLQIVHTSIGNTVICNTSVNVCLEVKKPSTCTRLSEY